MTRTAILVSGTGRSLQNLLELERAGSLPTETVLVVSSKAGVRALEHASAFDIASQVCEADALTDALDAARVDLVVMAGYLKRWPIPDAYVGKTINIHPALLPLFGGKGMYGHHVHEAVIASGMRVSGCTVHFVTAEYDAGPIIGQQTVPVLWDDDPDTLAARVFEQECALLPQCVGMVARREVALVEGRAVRR
ncbi:MAG: phosphoribosylglycinamide formyltransferase [Planctomycetes bacterium]|nr:phosphoribosylglycinamide formyltransferase [Planctomycetota bacterium]